MSTEFILCCIGSLTSDLFVDVRWTQASFYVFLRLLVITLLPPHVCDYIPS